MWNKIEHCTYVAPLEIVTTCHAISTDPSVCKAEIESKFRTSSNKYKRFGVNTVPHDSPPGMSLPGLQRG